MDIHNMTVAEIKARLASPATSQQMQQYLASPDGAQQMQAKLRADLGLVPETPVMSFDQFCAEFGSQVPDPDDDPNVPSTEQIAAESEASHSIITLSIFYLAQRAFAAFRACSLRSSAVRFLAAACLLVR